MVKTELLTLLRERNKRNARKHLLDFVKYTMGAFQPTEFHKIYYEILDRFAKGQIKRLMISVPPQHGKSEGSTRRLPAFMLGLDPDKKLAVGSYSTPFARKFNRDVQRIIDTKKYISLFPETALNASSVVTVSSNSLRNADEFEIVDKDGGLKAVGRGGALTGNKVDVMIMDDLYKDYMEGNSPIIRDNVWDWYTSVVQTRLHNDSQELIVFTRWHEKDLIGMLEDKETVLELESLEQLDGLDPDTWVKINFEAIKTTPPTEIDPRGIDEVLWEERHNLNKLTKSKNLDEEKFSCLYQGNPKSQKGLLYGDFETYKDLPEYNERKNYTDTADTGSDYLASICYVVGTEDKNLYVTDMLYSSEPMEVTEPDTIQLLKRNDTQTADIESNNGGRGFARVIERETEDSLSVNAFHQSANKESRIISNSTEVNRRVLFPSDWKSRWPQAYEHIKMYKKNFKANKHDDLADALTGMVEVNQEEEIYFF